MGESPPLLIRRDAQRRLSLAIAWFLAVPAFVFGLAAMVAPMLPYLFRECGGPPPCSPFPGWMAPSFVLPGTFGILVAGFSSIALYRLTYRRPDVAWRIVAGLGVVMIGVALVAIVVAREPEMLLAAFVWPLLPGLIAVDAARRAG